MKQILEEEKIIGKTIKSTGYGDNTFCLIFTDETFCIIRGTGWDENDVEFYDHKISLTPTSRNSYNLIKMGLITKEEANEAEEKEFNENIKKVIEFFVIDETKIDEAKKNMIIDWFDANYIDRKESIYLLLKKAETEHDVTLKSLFESCQVLKIKETSKISLRIHLNYLIKLSEYGLNGYEAGFRLIELLKS